MPRWENCCNSSCSDVGAPLANTQPKASPGCSFTEPGCISKNLFWQRIVCLSRALLFAPKAKLSTGRIPAQHRAAVSGESPKGLFGSQQLDPLPLPRVGAGSGPGYLGYRGLGTSNSQLLSVLIKQVPNFFSEKRVIMSTNSKIFLYYLILSNQKILSPQLSGRIIYNPS